MKKKGSFKIITKKVKRMISSFFREAIAYSKTNVLFCTFVITSLINASLLRMMTVKNVFDISPILADLSVILLIGAFGYLLKPKHQFKYFFTFAVIFTTICIINSVYYNNYISFVSFSLLKTSSYLKGLDSSVVTGLIGVKDIVYLFQIVALLFVNQYLKKTHYYEEVTKIEIGKERLLNTMVGGLIVLGLFISTLTSTDIGRLNKQWNRDLVMLKFGTYTYQLNDLFLTVKSKINPLFGYEDAALSFREYFGEGKEKKENKYTNIFEGKNVIVIHAESIQNYLLNTSFNGVEVTPNLKRLSTEGLYFSNFYAEESVGTSSDSEFTYASSLMPASSGSVFVNYFDRNYVTLQKLLKEQGYYVFSMHGNNCSYWNRNVAHQSLGYDHFYCYKDAYTIDEKIGLGLSDKSFFRQSADIIEKVKTEHNRFYGTLIMLSNHTPFNDDGVAYSDLDVTMHYTEEDPETGETIEKVAPYMEGTKLGYYFKSAHYADQAIGEFIENLDSKGLLDNTVLVIYGDHDSKLRKSDYARFYNYDPKTNDLISKEDPAYIDVDYYQYEINRSVPLIIWTKDHKYKQEITTTMGMIDVAPTLANMFGVYNEYALGHDMFSLEEGEENLVVFPDGDWITNKMYYSHSKDAARLLDPTETVSAEYITENNAIADTIISLSDAIIVHNLIEKIGPEVTGKGE